MRILSFIFISSSSNDKAIANAAYENLEQKGIKCWSSDKNIQSHQNYNAAILKAIHNCRAMVFIYSSSAESSQDVLREVREAAENNKIIIPFIVENKIPSQNMEVYLQGNYKIDATTSSIYESIYKLENLLKNLLGEQMNAAPQAAGPQTTVTRPQAAAASYSPRPDIPGPNRPVAPKKSKAPLIIGISAVAVVCLILLAGGIFGMSVLLAPTDEPHVEGITTTTSNGAYDIGLKVEQADTLYGSNFTEEEIIEFAKEAIRELDRTDSGSEFYQNYRYQGPEYNDLFNLQEDVLFAMMGLEVVRFDDVKVMGKNNKDFGTEYLLSMDFTVYANYDRETETGEIEHIEGEASLYNNVVIIETNDGELKYLYMESIKQEDLENRYEKIDSFYEEMKEKELVDAEDTVQSYVPSDSSIDDNSLKSVKEIVEENDHKVVAVFVDTAGGEVQGSGFFIEDGIIVTNFHVIEGGRRAYVRLTDERLIEVEGIVCTNPALDLAIIKLTEQIGIEPVSLGGMVDVQKGEMAVAIGSPLGLFNTVSTGIVSNTWEQDGVYLIQISIPITHGNSGGALFDDSGKVIGVTTSGIGEANLNFAVSTEHLLEVYEIIKEIGYDNIEVVPFK